MGVGTFVHHFGTLLLLVATALLIVVSVTAPAVNSLAILRVKLNDGSGSGNGYGYGYGSQGSEVTFGSFGYCERGILNSDRCSGSHIGYDPAQVMTDIDNTQFGTAAQRTSRALTRVMILHPIGAALCFIAFLLCLGTSIVGSLGAVFFALIAFVITIVAMACDFAAFGIVRNHVNDNGPSVAHWASGIWCILAAAVCTLFAATLVLLTCCAGRAKKRRHEARSKDAEPVAAAPATEDAPAAARRPFWKRG